MRCHSRLELMGRGLSRLTSRKGKGDDAGSTLPSSYPEALFSRILPPLLDIFTLEKEFHSVEIASKRLVARDVMDSRVAGPGSAPRERREIRERRVIRTTHLPAEPRDGVEHVVWMPLVLTGLVMGRAGDEVVVRQRDLSFADLALGRPGAAPDRRGCTRLVYVRFERCTKEA